jgi:hypothetical protein
MENKSQNEEEEEEGRERERRREREMGRERYLKESRLLSNTIQTHPRIDEELSRSQIIQ